jgi:hypothetical protein
MGRNRNILLDVQNGVIYSNTDTIADATLDNVIAKTSRRAIPIVIKTPGTPVQLVSGTLGWGINANTRVTGVRMDCMKTDPSVANSSVAPNGGNLNIAIRKISSDAVSSILGTFSIVSGSITSYSDVSYNLVTNDSIYVDVTGVGTLNPGNGLKVTLFYYGGV